MSGQYDKGLQRLMEFFEFHNKIDQYVNGTLSDEDKAFMDGFVAKYPKYRKDIDIAKMMKASVVGYDGEMVGEFLKRGQELRKAHIISDIDREFLLATESGIISDVMDAIDRGANVNAKNEYGSTALIMAADYGYADIVDLLISKDADPLIKNIEGKTATDRAIISGHKALFFKLREYSRSSEQQKLLEGLISTDEQTQTMDGF